MIAVAVLFSMAAWAFAGKQVGVSKYNFVTDSLRLPVVLVGMGVFLLFQRREFHSRVVNAAAGSAFAVYLITDYQPSQKLLWQTWLDLGGLMSLQGLFVALGALVGIYAACTVIDLVRRRVFAATGIDRA